MATQLVFETHAITTDNEAGNATGWLPGRLSARGRRTAAELGKRRQDDGIAVVFVSDLDRAVDTARIAFEGTDMLVIQDARLRECDYGDLNGMPTERLFAERVTHLDDPWPGGESYKQVVARIRSFIVDLSERWDGSRVLVIGHSANKWALDHLLLGEPLSALVEAGLCWQAGWEYVLPMGGGREEAVEEKAYALPATSRPQTPVGRSTDGASAADLTEEPIADDPR